jgi:hypothetical protein
MERNGGGPGGSACAINSGAARSEVPMTAATIDAVLLIPFTSLGIADADGRTPRRAKRPGRAAALS